MVISNAGVIAAAVAHANRAHKVTPQVHVPVQDAHIPIQDAVANAPYGDGFHTIISHFSQGQFLQDHILCALTLLISIGCLICVVSGKIDDGIWGKVFTSIVAFGSLGVFSNCISHIPNHSHIPEITMATGVLLYCLREIWNAYITRPFNKWYYEKHPKYDRRLNSRGMNR